MNIATAIFLLGCVSVAASGCLEIPPFPAHLLWDAEIEDLRDTDSDIDVEETGPTTCTTDSQCGDENACNGVETCGDDGLCMAGEPPICPDEDNPCATFVCVSATGACKLETVTDESPCESDGSTCLQGGTCLGGKCTENLPFDTQCTPAEGDIGFCRDGECSRRKIAHGLVDLCVLSERKIRCAGNFASEFLNFPDGVTPAHYYGNGATSIITSLSEAKPVGVAPYQSFKDIGGFEFGGSLCGLTWQDGLACWGPNTKGGLGIGWNEPCMGPLGDSTDPTAVEAFEALILGDDEAIADACFQQMADGSSFSLDDGLETETGELYIASEEAKKLWLSDPKGNPLDAILSPHAKLPPLFSNPKFAFARSLYISGSNGQIITQDGALHAWGKGGVSRGLKDTDDPIAPDDAQPLLPQVSGFRLLFGHAALSIRCALTDATPPELYCWGAFPAIAGHAIDTSAEFKTYFPSDLSPLKFGDWVPVEVVGTFSGFCGRDELGSVRCWGGLQWLSGSTDLPGKDDAVPPAEATIIAFDRPVLQLVTGLFNICGLLDDGRVQCIGAGINETSSTHIDAKPMTLP